MPQTSSMIDISYKKTIRWCCLILFISIFYSPASHQTLAYSAETADALLDIERKIELTKRMLELRKLQVKQQKVDMGMFKSSVGIKNGPVVIRVPSIQLESIYSYHNTLMASIRYGQYVMNVAKGDSLEQGVNVLDITSQHVALNIHGRKIKLGIVHTPAPSSASSNGQHQ